ADEVRPGCRCKSYPFKMVAGASYVINLLSRDFDAYLRVEDANGKALAEDDDSGGSLDARLVFTAPRTETYQMVATTFAADQGGAFTLQVARVGVVPAPGSVRVIAPHRDVGDIAVLADAGNS